MLSEILEEPSVLERIEKENESALIAFANEFKKRKITHITFAARGTSDHASIFGQYLYTIIGGAVAGLATCSAITAYGADVSYSNDLVIGISQSGSAADVSEVLASARAKGALTLAITNYRDSRLAKAAEHHLFCAAGEELSVAATKTFTSQIALLILSCAYAYDNKALLEDFRKVTPILRETLSFLGDNVSRYSESFVSCEDGFILSRGLSYSIALEASLKLQETCYMKIRGSAVSDFWHGPLAQIEKDTPVIVLCPSGKCLENCDEMAEKIRSIGANLLVVTDNSAIAEKYERSLLLPCTGSEFTSPIVFASFAQCFAESLCAAKGLDPDSPRNLKKVTVTL